MFRTISPHPHPHPDAAMPRGRVIAAAAALITALLVTGCSGAPVAGSAVPVPVTATITAPTTLTATETATVTDTATVRTTATERTTRISTKTLIPKPAGTTTVVHTRTKVKTSVKTVTAPPPKPKVAFGDGTYVVGKDVAPGIYQASDPNPGDGLCYWETDSVDGEIIDNGVNNGIVHVGSSVFSLRVEDCGDWRKVG